MSDGAGQTTWVILARGRKVRHCRLSTAIGCNGIMNDELDVVLVGGVDLSIDPFEVIGFSRNGALAKREMEVFSSKSQGFWPGEAAG